MKLLNITLKLFNNTNKTTSNSEGNDLSPEMKVFYNKQLIKEFGPKLVHSQFGQKTPMPKNGGKQIEWRKYDSLPKATTALTEGVTPNGSPLNVSTVTATLSQYGAYIELTDLLLVTAIDNNLVQATRKLADQAGRTIDTIHRNVMLAGTNVQFAGGVAARANLVGGSATEAENNILTVKEVRKSVRTLRVFNAEPINGYYVGIIHPDCSYDIMNDPEWKYPHQYVDTKNIYAGEIGSIAGVRFVETSEAGIFKKAGINKETGSAVSSDRDVYATLIIGADAYGIPEVEGEGGIKHIVHNLGSGGVSDPLDQLATAGWKCLTTAAILVQQYMVRIESTSSFNDAPANGTV